MANVKLVSPWLKDMLRKTKRRDEDPRPQYLASKPINKDPETKPDKMTLEDQKKVEEEVKKIKETLR